MTTSHGLRRGGLLVALALAAILVVGLGIGLHGAFASSDAPSPAADKTVLHLGWTNDPDSLNPFIGYESSSYEVWAINYDLLVGFRASDMANEPGIGLAQAWETSRPTARSGPSRSPTRPSGRTASRSPPPTWPSPTTT